MVLTEEGFWFLVRNGAWLLSLALCLILLLFPTFRRRTNPLAWLVWANLAAGAVWYGQFPIADAQEARFKTSDPGYAAAALPFTGRSLYIPDPRPMRHAAYACYGSYSASCEMPVAKMLRDEQLDFVEMGTDPITRYTISVHDPRCVDWTAEVSSNFSTEPFILNDGFIVPGLAACVVRGTVDAPTASHTLTVSRLDMPFPSRERYYNVQLRDRTSGTLIDQFDGWNRATPFFAFMDDPFEPRRNASGPLADLLMIQGAYASDERAVADRYLARYGVDEDLMRAAMASPYQMIQARTLALACRDGVVTTLTPETRAFLRDAGKGVFRDRPDWSYPQDCHPSTR